MAILPDDALKTAQHEVQRLLGRCLLRLQQFERQIKAIVAHHEISGPADNLEAVRAARRQDSNGKTLGTLVGSLLGSVVTSDVSTLDKETNSPAEHGTWINMHSHMEFPEADFVRIKNELKEFVRLRNNLVHHFIEQHDLWSLDGCRGAHDALIEADNRTGKHIEKLQEWCEEMQKTQRAFAEFLQSDEGRELLVNGIAADGTVHWPCAGVVYALRAAASNLAVDGWTSVMEASKWIAEREPEQIPAKYGCSSWRQVVHKSGLFELRYFEKGGQRFPRYREKTISTNSH